jgi:hypothetical protein
VPSPEELARLEIDRLLTAAGWVVQDYRQVDLTASRDIAWLKDESLADSDNLPPPEVIAQEIVEDLEAALAQFRLIAADLNGDAGQA